MTSASTVTHFPWTPVAPVTDRSGSSAAGLSARRPRSGYFGRLPFRAEQYDAERVDPHPHGRLVPVMTHAPRSRLRIGRAVAVAVVAMLGAAAVAIAVRPSL